MKNVLESKWSHKFTFNNIKIIHILFCNLKKYSEYLLPS